MIRTYRDLKVGDVITNSDRSRRFMVEGLSGGYVGYLNLTNNKRHTSIYIDQLEWNSEWKLDESSIVQRILDRYEI